MSYDYREEMRADIRAAIEEHCNHEGCSANDHSVDWWDDFLWIDDSVTGNGSGSYTFNSWTAKEYVTDNMELAAEAYTELCAADRFMDDIVSENWESMDVTIRCYLLFNLVYDVLAEIEEESEEE